MLKASVYRTLLSSRHIVRGAGARGALAAVSFSASSSEAAWSSSSSYSSTALAAALSAALVAGAVALSASASPAHCDVHKPTAEDSLPVYRLSEVANHKTNKTRVWVTYGDGESLCNLSSYNALALTTMDFNIIQAFMTSRTSSPITPEAKVYER